MARTDSGKAQLDWIAAMQQVPGCRAAVVSAGERGDGDGLDHGAEDSVTKLNDVHYQVYHLVSENRTACRLLTDPKGPLLTSIWRHHVTCEECKASMYYRNAQIRWAELRS